MASSKPCGGNLRHDSTGPKSLSRGTICENPDLHNREQALMKPVLVVNLDVKDNHEEAAAGAKLALDLCQEIEATDCWEDTVDNVVAAFERQHKRKLIYSISFY